MVSKPIKIDPRSGLLSWSCLCKKFRIQFKYSIIFSAKVIHASNHPLLHFVSINEAKFIYAGPTFPQIPNQTDSGISKIHIVEAKIRPTRD